MMRSLRFPEDEKGLLEYFTSLEMILFSDLEGVFKAYGESIQ
jgi:hypothetical protein